MSLVIIVSLPFLVWIYFYESVSQDILSISDTAGVIRSICNVKKFSYLVYPASKRGGELYDHIEKGRIGFEDLKRQQLFHDQIFQPSFISFINEISFVEIYRYFTPRTREGCDNAFSYYAFTSYQISIHTLMESISETGIL